MPDLQHLEHIVQSKRTPRLDTLCKNILYSEIRDGGGSVPGLLRDQFAYTRAGKARVHTAQKMIEQLDLARQFQFPTVHDWVHLMTFCFAACGQMMKEADGLGYFLQDQDDLAQIDAAISEAAKQDLEYIERFYPRGGLTKEIRPDSSLEYAGIQMAKMLIEYINSFEKNGGMNPRHVPYLMRIDSCLDTLVVHMQGLHTLRRLVSTDMYQRVNRNYTLFVQDLSGARENYAQIVIDNRSLSIRTATSYSTR